MTDLFIIYSFILFIHPLGSNIGNSYETHQHRFGERPSFGSSAVHYRIASHRNVDNEEAMDIDVGHDEMEVHSPVSPTTHNKIVSF